MSYFKKSVRQGKKVVKTWARAFLVLATILWSIGISTLIPNIAHAVTVTVTGPFDLLPSPSGTSAPASSFDIPVIRFALNQTADPGGETLSSVTITVTSTVPTNNATLATHLSSISVFCDSNSNSYFDPGTDLLAGTQTTVNVGSATTVATNSNNSLAATGASPTSFFVAIRTAGGWTAGDSIYINMAANGIATSANSPTITALTGSKYINFGGGGGWSGFSISSATYLNATTVDVLFTDNLDLNSGVATTTAYYSFSGTGASAVTSVTILPDNRSVRVSASGANLISTGASLIAVTGDVKNTTGMANANTSAMPIYGGMMPYVISEIKAGETADQYDEFVEIYNNSASVLPTSTLKLHILNAAGTVDTNVSLTWRNNNLIPTRGFLLITSAWSSASSSADAIYSTSTLLSLVPDGAIYISNSSASSTAVLDRVCWGSHSVMGDCEGTAASALLNNGQSIERKAFGGSTSASMTSDTSGHGFDTQNNSYDFVARSLPQAQNTSSPGENPSGGFYGGDANQQPQIQMASVFRATASSTFNLVARISDDSGILPAGNTKLIFCTDDTNTCAPASSTPIYGVSIGSGWYKFTPTSTPWSNNKTYFRYYLQATDSANPAKSRVYTNNPSYDSTTYQATWAGIQTQADQIAKAFSATLVQGNLGSASINGTINNSSNAAVSGATVWIDGAQFAATTGQDGTFSFANVGPSGGVQIKVAKEGYMDQSLSTYLPTSGLVNIGTLTLYSGTMGQGGDYTMPRVASSFPMPGMMGFPTQSPTGGAPPIDITFSKSMDSTTIVDTNAGNDGSNIYLTEAGSSTKIGGAVTAPTATQARFTSTAALTVGRNYTLFITSGVKDTAGNPISGNGPGGAYVLSFGTTGQMYETPGTITGFGTGNAFPPFVIGSQPAPGKVNVATNSKAFVTFSDSLQNTAANLANVKLYRVTNSYTSSEAKTEVSATNSLDASQKIVIVTPSQPGLVANTSYRVEVTGGLISSKGIPLGNPGTSGYATNVMYKSDFQTGSGADGTAPTISGTIPADSATGVSTIKPIVISFSEAMNPSTITDSSVSLKLGSTVVATDLTYDPNNRTATIVSDYALTASSTYTIYVATDVSDLASQVLAVALQRTFTTGSSDTTAPLVTSAQANDFALKVSFSRPMLAVTAGDINYAYSVLKKENYAVRRVNGTTGATLATITLPDAATLSYDATSRSVAINGVSGLASGDYANIVVSNVKDIGYTDLSSAGNAATTTAQSSATTGGFNCGPGMMGGGPMMDAGGNIMQGGMMGGPPPMVGTFMNSGIGFAPPVRVYPFNTMAGVSTIYGVEIPISYQIPNAGFIDITFPEGTDVTNAKKDTASPPNADLNGPGPGTVVFGTNEGTLPTGWTTGGAASDGVIVDATSRKVRVILGAVATHCGTGNTSPCTSGDQHDFLRLDIAQIINSTLATGIDTFGSSATVETKKSDGTVLETLSSGSFFTSAAGNFTVRGHATTTTDGINGINIFLMSPMTGPMSSSSAANRYGTTNGEFMFQNLLAGTYMLGADQFAKSGGTSYMAGFPKSVTVSAATCPSNICTADVSLTLASSGATVTLSISGVFSNQAIDIFAGGPGSFRKTTSTLDGTLTNDTSNSIKVNTNGIWMIGFGPQMSTEIFGKAGPTAPTTWMPPRPQEVVVSGCPAACAATPSSVSFNVSAADKTIKFTVKDALSNALANAHVFAYSPGGGTGNDTMANADGTGSIKLSAGTYKIGADVSGMPSGQERSITISGSNVYIDGSTTAIAWATMVSSDLILTLSKPSYTISGKVTDGTNAVSNAPMNAYRTDGPGRADSFTNSSGEYTLYVNNGTWKVQVFTPDYGKLPEKTITVSGANVTGQNFEPNIASTNYATVTKSVAVDADADGTLESGEGVANAQIIIEGTTASGEKYFNTSLTDTNGSSTLKVPPGAYTMKAWSPTYGEMSSSTQNLVVNSAGTATTAPYDVLAPQTGAVIVNILDSNGNATSTSKAIIEMMQIGGKIDKAGSYSNVSSTLLSLPIFDAGADNVSLNNVTSTNPSNFYLLEVNIPGVSQGDLIAYGGNSTILATSTAANGFWKVEVDGNETINIKLPDLKYISGTVKDGSGTAVPDATVHLENKTTGETIDVQADSSGNYSTKVSSGTYLMQADKDGYIDTASTVAISANGALADSATTVTAANYTITGMIRIAGTAVSGAIVRAERLGGGVVTATTGSDGTYTLNVIAGDWKVSASADGYTETAYGVAAASASGVNINLTATNANLAGSTSASVTPQTGGSLSDTTANFSIGAGEAALGSGANAYSLNEKETSNVVGGGSGNPLSGEAKSVTSYDNEGDAVTYLNKDVAVGATYSISDLTTSLGALTVAKLQKVTMASWDETADNWQNLPTTIGYKNSSGQFIEPSTGAASLTYTGQTSHFSVFNPIVKSDGLAPSAPTTVSASAGNATVTITWVAPTTNADSSALTDLLGYEIYRSTSAGGTYTQLNTSDLTSTSYTDSTVTNGTTYYYKVTAADTGGLESAMSSASNVASPVAPTSGSTGGGASIIQPAPKFGATVVSVEGGTAVSSRYIVLKFDSSDSVQMAISENSNFTGSVWESYIATKNYTLSTGLGTKKLYFKFRTALGGESDVKVLEINKTAEGTAPEIVTPATPALSVVPSTQPSTSITSLVTPAPSAITEIILSNSASKVQVSDITKASYQPNEVLRFKYQFKNEGAKKMNIKVVRQMLDSKNKAVKTITVWRTLKSGQSFNGDAKEILAKSLKSGEYTIKVKIFDNQNKVLDENSFKINVEKLKLKYFNLGAPESNTADIIFDEASLAKIKSNVKLPISLKAKYSYTNNTEEKHTVRMVRELVNESGKILGVKTGKWVMKVGEKDTVSFVQSVANNLVVGNYTIRLRAYDWKTKELLAENSLRFNVELK